jgi:transcriptional regulator with XRE-family HTH domain
MKFYRVQDKIISQDKIDHTITRIMELRQRGLSQKDVSDQTGVDRTFISRLETMGEVRKGSRIAVVGFPIQNKDELHLVCTDEGVDYVLLMTEHERLNFVNERSGKELLDDVMNLIGLVRTFDVVVMLGSDYRLNLLRGVLDCEVVPLEIGHSPLTEDVWVDPENMRRLLKTIRSSRSQKL